MSFLQEVMMANNISKCVDWNFEAAGNGGEIPMTDLEEEAPLGEWGRMASVGAHKQGHMRKMEKFWGGNTRQTMFDLVLGINGEHLAAKTNAYHFSEDAAMVGGKPLPYMRYGTIRAEKSPMWNHPNNVAHRLANSSATSASKNPRKRNRLGADASGSEEESSQGEEKEEDGAGGGEWRKEAVEGRPDYYELDFGKCKKDAFFVSKTIFEGGNTGLTVGKVMCVVDEEKKTFQAKTFNCTESELEAICIEAAWHPAQQKKPEVLQNYAVLVYFKGLTRANKLPKKVQAALLERSDFEWRESQREHDEND
jgi:hypothetical protein